MVREFLLFIKYPYTAGIISVVWLGSAALLAIEPELDIVQIMATSLLVTIIIAALGFRGKQEV